MIADFAHPACVLASGVSVREPLWATAAILVAGAAAAVLWRTGVGRRPTLALSGGLILLAAALGGPTLAWSRAPVVAVWVDVSPSTRSAGFRDIANLRRRIAELLGTPAADASALTRFAGGATGSLPSDASHLAEAPVDRTTLPPSPAGVDALLLFSDGQFDVPTRLPAVYAVIDPAIAAATDASIAPLVLLNNRAIATTDNAGPARTLAWSTAPARPVLPGRSVHSAPAGPPGSVVSAQLDPGDPWPENDSAAIHIAATESRRLWIGPTAPPPGWQAVEPGAPGDAGTLGLVDVEVIAIDSVAAEEFDQRTMGVLESYVRDLGGTLVLSGGTGIDATGGWTGTSVGRLSPLDPHPPEPRRQWTLLIDASGSMAGPVDASVRSPTRLQIATAAAQRAVEALPPADLVRVGSFSRQVRWWAGAARPAGGAFAALAAPPADLEARGPTNLGPALESLLVIAPGGAVAHEAIVITDGDVPAGALARLAERLRSSGVRVHVLLTGDPARAGELAGVARATGGMVLPAGAPAAWATAAADLVARSTPTNLEPGTFEIRFDAASPGPVTADRRYRTWLRQGAREIATFDADTAPAAARWTIGAGQCMALAWNSGPDTIAALAARLDTTPARDPRFTVELLHDSDRRRPTLRVAARDDGRPLNGLTLRARVGPPGQNPSPLPMEQVAPGQYSLVLDRSEAGRVADVFDGSRRLARVAVPSQASAEFDAIGLNRPRLEELVRRFGGAVIEPEQTGRLPIPRPMTQVDLSPWLAAAGASLLMIGMWMAPGHARRSVT